MAYGKGPSRSSPIVWMEEGWEWKSAYAKAPDVVSVSLAWYAFSDNPFSVLYHNQPTESLSKCFMGDGAASLMHIALFFMNVLHELFGFDFIQTSEVRVHDCFCKQSLVHSTSFRVYLTREFLSLLLPPCLQDSSRFEDIWLLVSSRWCVGQVSWLYLPPDLIGRDAQLWLISQGEWSRIMRVLRVYLYANSHRVRLAQPFSVKIVKLKQSLHLGEVFLHGGSFVSNSSFTLTYDQFWVVVDLDVAGSHAFASRSSVINASF